MTTTQRPTICAIATPIGRGGVGVIRLSGKTAHAIAKQLTGKTSDFVPRHASFCRFWDSRGELIDEGLVIYFNAPHSFTGEDVVEIQGHGGVVLQQTLLARCFELGAKQASAGEFSYRAFDNDKLDLLQAEAIADAIDATSIAAAKSAMRSLSGEFSNQINDLLQKLIHLRLYVEASIDFSDEEGVDFLADTAILAQLTALQNQLNQLLNNAAQGQLLKDGIVAVIAGRPNAGKSSLLNRLAKQERAIVTDIAGTTRDVLHERLVLNGLTVNITDTAGLRQTFDVVEQIGIERTKTAVNTADLLLLVYDVNCDDKPLALIDEFFGQLPQGSRVLLIGNKIDKQIEQIDKQNTTAQASDLTHKANKTNEWLCDEVFISCQTGQGLDNLVDKICDMVGFHPPEDAIMARTRHLDALKRVQIALALAYEQLTVYQAGELVAESLRMAQQDLGEITGEFRADDLLGRIFGQFCIGK